MENDILLAIFLTTILTIMSSLVTFGGHIGFLPVKNFAQGLQSLGSLNMYLHVSYGAKIAFYLICSTSYRSTDRLVFMSQMLIMRDIFAVTDHLVGPRGNM